MSFLRSSSQPALGSLVSAGLREHRFKGADRSMSLLMPHVEADLKAALRVRVFETVEGEPREFVVAGYELE